MALAAFEPVKSRGNFESLSQLERMAYGSTSIIENMGTVFVIWMVFFFYVTIVQLMRYICFPLMKNKCFRTFYRNMNKKLLWGSFLRLGLEVYLEASIAAQINIRNYHLKKGLSEFSDLHNEISYYCSIIFGTILVLFPFVSAFFLLYKKTEIN